MFVERFQRRQDGSLDYVRRVWALEPRFDTRAVEDLTAEPLKNLIHNTRSILHAAWLANDFKILHPGGVQAWNRWNNFRMRRAVTKELEDEKALGQESPPLQKTAPGGVWSRTVTWPKLQTGAIAEYQIFTGVSPLSMDEKNTAAAYLHDQIMEKLREGDLPRAAEKAVEYRVLTDGLVNWSEADQKAMVDYLERRINSLVNRGPYSDEDLAQIAGLTADYVVLSADYIVFTRDGVVIDPMPYPSVQ